jgi:hypothetical protein
MGEIFRTECVDVGYPIYEITSSGLTHSIDGYPFADKILEYMITSKYRVRTSVLRQC